MHIINRTLYPALLASLAWPATQAMAITQCTLTPPGASQKVYERDLGTLYVGRDVALNEVIGNNNLVEDTPDLNGLSLDCEADNYVINFDFRAVNGQTANRVINTNVPGIGVMVQMGNPFLGGPNEWRPDDGVPVFVPFNAYHENTVVTGPKLESLHNTITLVKTADLAPGEHLVDGPLFTGHLDWGGMGQVLQYSLKARVIQSECEVDSGSVTTQVDLEDWSISQLAGPGHTTTPTPFSIRLINCLAPPAGGTLIMARMELNGIDGSAPTGPAGEHVFSLTSDSDAAGVGIQVLLNNNPVPLDTVFRAADLTSGSIPLNFQARYYQLEPRAQVRTGTAKGALRFTMHYR